MFGSLMGDGFDDFFGGHMRRMNTMMNSFFGNPFGNDLLGNGGGHSARSTSMGLIPFQDRTDHMLSPLGFPNMNHIMRSMSQMSNDPSCHSFSSSSVMTMTTGPDGKPQVYQASASTRSAPGGVRETKKAVCDSRSGVKKMSIGHHIGDRAHIKEKEQNIYSGELEENEEYVNLDEEEAPEFNREWQNKTQHFKSSNLQHSIEYRHPSRENYVSDYLALPPAPSAEGRERRSKSPQKKKSHRSKPYNNKRKEKKRNE